MCQLLRYFCTAVLGVSVGASSSAGQRVGSAQPDSASGIPAGTPGPTLPRTQAPAGGSIGSRPIYVSGRVMLEDGTPPPDSVLVERVCNGIARPEGYTDSKGRFSFQLGQNSAAVSDASANSGVRVAGMPRGRGTQAAPGPAGPDLGSCELRASLGGYRAAVVQLAGRRGLENPDVGVIILHRLANVEGRTVSMTSLAASKTARKAYDGALDAVRKQKFDEARKRFQKAVTEYPRYAAAWYELGRVQGRQGNFEEARRSYGQAVAADPKYVNPYVELAAISVREKKWREVSEVSAKIIRLDPLDFPEALLYSAVASYNLGDLSAAEEDARRARELDTGHRLPRINFVLGVILAERGNYSSAAEHIREYLRLAADSQEGQRARELLRELEARVANPQPK